MTGAVLEKPLEKLVLHSFLDVYLWRGKVIYRIPQRRICSDNNDIWPGTEWRLFTVMSLVHLQKICTQIFTLEGGKKNVITTVSARLKSH